MIPLDFLRFCALGFCRVLALPPAARQASSTIDQKRASSIGIAPKEPQKWNPLRPDRGRCRLIELRSFEPPATLVE